MAFPSFTGPLLRAATVALALLSAACVVQEKGYASYPPVPPARSEFVPPPPRGNQWGWQPGHWHWDGGRYEWLPGRYVERAPNHRWYPAHWEQRGREHFWVAGHWG